MRRALALILALIMTCAVFAGCSKAGVKDSDITAFDENAKYTYTSWAAGLASNWNPHDYEDADSSDMMSYLIDSFYTFFVGSSSRDLKLSAGIEVALPHDEQNSQRIERW